MKREIETEKQSGLKSYIVLYGRCQVQTSTLFCGFYITIGLQSDSEPKDFHNHDASYALKKTDVFKNLLSK